MSEYFNKNDLFLEPKTTQYGSHMVMTNVHKPNKTKHINIDTKFRDEYNYLQSANYNITLPEKINEVKSITLESMEIPMTFFNISANLGNNCFKLINNTSPNSPTIITVPDGQYNLTGIQTQINTLVSMVDASLGFVLSNNYYSSFTNKLNSKTYTIEFDVTNTGVPDKYNFKMKLGWILGFRNISYNLPSTNNIVSEQFIDLTGPRYLYLAIEEFNKGNQNSFISPLSSSFINKNIIARITLDTKYQFGSILPVNTFTGLLSDTRNYTGKIDIQKLNIQLLNETGIPMVFNGLDFSFCLKLEHEA